MTSSGLAAHSSSILLASISSFCLSSDSGQSIFATKRRDSLSGRRVWRTCHQASIGILPVSRQTRFVARSGLSLFDSLSIAGTLPQPHNAACSNFERPAFSSARSIILGRSKLSILYPVMKSGSSSRTNLVIPSRISFSEPRNSCSVREFPLAITTAAQSIVLCRTLVSRSNERVTNGVGNGSVRDRSATLQATTISHGYNPEPPKSRIFSAASTLLPSNSLDNSEGARGPAHRTSPTLAIWGPRSKSNNKRWTNRISALDTSHSDSSRFLSLGTTYGCSTSTR